ncbi:MAG TPA: hypothetical protein VMJ66_00340 [Geobacteraceae bacterium]|nr:hypothetical protein [Geobacteraceae bacterium]
MQPSGFLTFLDFPDARRLRADVDGERSDVSGEEDGESEDGAL